MKITAPTRWLDDVDIAALRQSFLDRGFVARNLQWLDSDDDDNQQVLLPENLRSYCDWRSRLLEAIEQAAMLDGITAAEWFERTAKTKRTAPGELPSRDSDRCPETGQADCQRCSGEFCEQHGTQPCECDVAERHQPDDKSA